MAKTNWDAVHEKLERQGKFDEYTTPYNFDHTIKVDGNYVYINRNVFFRAFSAFIRGLLFVAGPLVTKTAFGCKVKGRENFDAVKDTGCFSVSNSYMSVFVTYNYYCTKSKSSTTFDNFCNSVYGNYFFF